MSLYTLGWDQRFAADLASRELAGVVAARVVAAHRGEYDLATEGGELRGRLAGRLAHLAGEAKELPAVGDWVAAAPRSEEGRATIHAILDRRTALRRRAPGDATRAQILAANVDLAFVMAPLDRDLAPTAVRVQRYLTLVRDSGATAAVLLTKADLCPDVRAQVARVRRAAAGAPVHVTSSATRTGLSAISALVAPGCTAVLLGPSGAGKSTLINELLGVRLLETRELGNLGEGRHASVRRELVLLPSGGAIIDTPGLREIDLWLGDDDALLAGFADVADLALACRFRDCGHLDEPGCSVRAAIDDGRIDRSRLVQMRDLQRELAHLDRARDARAASEERRRWRRVNRAARRARE